MNIEVNNKTHIAEINRASSGIVNKKAEKTEPEVTKTDSVDLSIATAVNSLATEPEVDTDRVAEIKNALANGSYQIDNEKLARNIINFEQNLPNTG
ncbi:MAG: negative regulator of flagellin synthesis FlgM [Methyloprofundus sp.]|nr:MAG: negative regulator of flagellin synthesis FlgM [Methyloprofundus sp.]